MCLTSKTNIAKIANKDIVCYKLIWRRFASLDYITAYRDTPISYDILRGRKNFVAEGPECIEPSFLDDGYSISSGFIHTFTKKEDAIKMAKMYGCLEHIWVVYKCVIPKGTKYFVSVDYDERCSTEIKFVEEIFRS